MSMTYYAVTDDPNELAHWGKKGMKWGVRHDRPRHTGSRRPRSVAYKKAQSKLGKMMKSGIKKAEAHWKAYNSPQAKEARFMKKAMQQARTGTLKYGKLTDDQVRRVTDRLALERNARQLGSTENPRYGKRLKMAVGEGIIRGIGQGTGAYIEERFRGRGKTTAEIKADKRKAKYEAKGSTIRRKVNKEADEEYYRQMAENGGAEGKIKTIARIGANTTVTALRSGVGAMTGLYNDDEVKSYFKSGMSQNKNLAKSMTRTSRTRVMRQKKLEDKNEERTKRQQEIEDRSYYTNLGKMKAEREFGTSQSKITDPTPKAIVKRSQPQTVVFTHKPVRNRDNRPTVTPIKRNRNRHGKR